MLFGEHHTVFDKTLEIDEWFPEPWGSTKWDSWAGRGGGRESGAILAENGLGEARFPTA
jgi:hypothetical protein